jgi:Uma2 family endonuclease
MRYTFEDYLSIPEDRAHRYEIIDGELFVTPTPVLRHQQVVMNLSRIFAPLALEHGLGELYSSPVTVRLRDDRVTEPDIAFVRADRFGILDPEKGILGAPDLVVEVLSPSNREYDRTLKRKRYMASGVAELWILDADEDTLEVWRPGMQKPQKLETPSESVSWRVGEQTFEIALRDIFRRRVEAE